MKINSKNNTLLIEAWKVFFIQKLGLDQQNTSYLTRQRKLSERGITQIEHAENIVDGFVIAQRKLNQRSVDLIEDFSKIYKYLNVKVNWLTKIGDYIPFAYWLVNKKLEQELQEFIEKWSKYEPGWYSGVLNDEQK